MKIFFISLLLLLRLPLTVLAQSTECASGTTPTVDLCDGLGFGTGGEPGQILTNFFAQIAVYVGLFAITMLVYSGFRMIVARGEPDELKTAKSSMWFSIIGLLASIGAFVLVFAIQSFIGASPISGGNDMLQNPLSVSNIQALVQNGLKNFLLLVGLLASVMIVYNVYLYISAGGNEEQSKKAKSGMTWSVVGFMLTILAYVIINGVTGLF